MSPFAKRPKEPEAFAFSLALSVVERPFFAPILRWSHSFLRSISPAIPWDVGGATPSGPRRRLLPTVFGATFFFCFVLTALLCLAEGTLWPAPPPALHFLDDYWNVSLYLAVCPTYVTLAVSIIVLTVQHWRQLHEFALAQGAVAEAEPSGRRLTVAAICIFLITSVGVTTYIYDGLSSTAIARDYWFVDVVNGVRTLNRVGCYYIALNFGLLLVTTTAVFCFFAVALETMSIGRCIQRGSITTFKELGTQLRSFVDIYVRMKWLVVIYMLNAYIWKFSPLGRADVYANLNLFVSGAVLTVVGIIFISIPRLYVEAKWHDYKHALHAKQPQAADETEELAYDDLRSGNTKLAVWILDVFLVGGFIKTFWDIEPHKILKIFEPDSLIDLIWK